MKIFIVVCSLFLMTGLVACGGATSSSDDTDDDATFTATDAQNVGAGLNNSQSAAFTAIMNQYATDAAKSNKSMALDLTKTTKSGTIPVNDVYNCQVGATSRPPETSIGRSAIQITRQRPPSPVPGSEASSCSRSAIRRTTSTIASRQAASFWMGRSILSSRTTGRSPGVPGRCSRPTDRSASTEEGRRAAS